MQAPMKMSNELFPLRGRRQAVYRRAINPRAALGCRNITGMSKCGVGKPVKKQETLATTELTGFACQLSSKSPKASSCTI